MDLVDSSLMASHGGAIRCWIRILKINDTYKILPNDDLEQEISPNTNSNPWKSLGDDPATEIRLHPSGKKLVVIRIAGTR